MEFLNSVIPPVAILGKSLADTILALAASDRFASKKLSFGATSPSKANRLSAEINEVWRGALLIAAAILVARSNCRRPSPALEPAIADAISHAEKSLPCIDLRWPVKRSDNGAA